MSLTYDQLKEAKQLFEAYELHGEYHDADDSVHNLLRWIEDHFLDLLAWANQEPMAHQLADADQALYRLETDRLKPHGDPTKDSLETHLTRLRAAIDGTDYKRG
jgi:hypothetical protein